MKMGVKEGKVKKVKEEFERKKVKERKVVKKMERENMGKI